MANPHLQPGRVYRTEEFKPFDANAGRVVRRLVAKGLLEALRKGLYYAPLTSSFGPVPPSESTLLHAFFRGRPYLRTGPSVWNSLSLGTTAVEVTPLVYNTTRSGLVKLAGRTFELRRNRFPRHPSAEFFVVDLIENGSRAGLDAELAGRALVDSLRAGRFDATKLEVMAAKYATGSTQAFVHDVIEAAA
ncbi:MAG: hypothetical protein Q8N53_24575 [Longimicrobiales bacterium]|nr:hypothetical protein [Longimicrobiales bacterium]